MSRGDGELLRKAREAYDAWNADDLERWLDFFDPEAEIYTSGLFFGLAPSYHGHEGASTYWRQMREPFEWFRMELVQLVERGPWAASAVRFRARGQGSGAETDLMFAHAARFENGRCAWLQAFASFDEALEASGLQDQA